VIVYDPQTREWIVDGRRVPEYQIANLWGRRGEDEPKPDVQNEADAREARRLMGVE
jgi:hypothetical protein